MKYEKYNSIQYVSNNWKANQGNSIDCNFNGLLSIKYKKASPRGRSEIFLEDENHMPIGILINTEVKTKKR